MQWRKLERISEIESPRVAGCCFIQDGQSKLHGKKELALVLGPS